MDLFSLCVLEGSIAASVSALPLLSSRSQSRKYCNLLLSSAIESFVKNADPSESDFDRTTEERRVIGDIFRFGIKLEDAARLEEEHKQGGEEDAELKIMYGSLPEQNSAPRLGTSVATYETDSDSEDYTRSNIRKVLCVGGSRQSSILNYVIPSIFDNDNEDEEAIRRAATSFIDNKKELSTMDFIDMDIEEEPEEDKFGVGPKNGTESISALVGGVLARLFTTSQINHPWKTIAALTQLILNLSKDMPSLDIFTDAIKMTPVSYFEQIIPTAEKDIPTSLEQFLVLSIDRCRTQITAMEAAWIVDFTLVLLQRLQMFPPAADVHFELNANLILICLIAGHVSDRAQDLLDGTDGSNSPLVQSYQAALQCDVSSVA